MTLTIEYCTELEESGVKFKGNLAVIKWFKTDGKAGSMSCFDYLDEAKKVMFEKHPLAKILLGIPILVCDIGE